MPYAPLSDLVSTRARIRQRDTDARSEMEACIAVSTSARCQHVFGTTRFDAARAEAAEPHRAALPLAGLAVTVKDLFDVAGQTTAAGSRVLADAAPAAQDCPAVARLRAAGGVITGRTHMVEFAFSGVGINPHLGTPANAASRDVPLIPGGSSSGAAVSVATGAAFVGLGSDTGGSIRIPAALNGIVGFKSTARLVPTQGAIPLSTTLDTACALTRSVEDAMLVHEVLAARPVVRSTAPLSAYRLAVVKRLLLDDLEPAVARAFERTLATLRRHGAQIVERDLPELDALAGINATGGFSAAESFAWHRRLLAEHGDAYDPRVALRIRRGATMGAAEYVDLLRARADWITRMQTRLAAWDALLCPTVPIVAPPIALLAPGAERDEAFFRVNGLLLRNTSMVNMLDGCAISIPCHTPDELPVGLMVWQGPMRDDGVLNVARQIESALSHA
ncbi:MAG: amidase [Rhodoferax sp.]|nr:amidase [Rhodoferax sp.]